MSNPTPNLDFEGASLPEIRAAMEERLAALIQKQKEGANFKNARSRQRIAVEQRRAEYLGEGFAILRGQRVPLNQSEELPENHFWIPTSKDHTGVWSIPDALVSDQETPLKGGVTSDGKKYLTEIARWYERISKIREYYERSESGVKTITWRGYSDCVPDEIKTKFRQVKPEGLGGGKRTSTQAIEARFACFHFEKILSQDFSPEIWTALENAFHAGRQSKTVDLHDSIQQDLINDAINKKQKEGRKKRRVEDLLRWKQVTIKYKKENPNTTPSEIRDQLINSNLDILISQPNGKLKWKDESGEVSKKSAAQKISRLLRNHKDEG